MQKSKYNAAVYVRLSKEDGDLDGVKAESNSISNQKSLIMNFLKSKNDIEVVSTFEDDGYSGSNFERPAFQDMMDEVKEGRINCIVVKDLSRFGREYIDSGRYIERLFPALGVRFIAINDGYDSADTSDQSSEIVIPFKNLMNDAYCRDISVKIRSHLEVKRQNGEYVGSFCPYGYRKDKDNHSVIVPDDFAAHVVRDIFAWIKEGRSLDTISRKLNEQGVPSPMEYKNGNGQRFRTSFKTHEQTRWYPVAVRRIATNPVYMGVLIQGRYTTPNHKIKQTVLKDSDKWAVVPNNHKPIVSERDFMVVQKALSMDTRTDPKHDGVYMLSGFAVCADCGNSMTRRVIRANGRCYSYYVCSSNKKKKGCCSPHRIREDALLERVTSVLKEMIGTLLDADEIVKSAGEERNHRYDMDVCMERIKENEDEINRYNKLLVEVFEDYREGVVDRDDFRIIKESFEEKKKLAEKAILVLQDEMQNISDRINTDDSWLDAFRENKNISELNRAILIELVQRVMVHEDGGIEVVLDCEDRYQEIIERAEKIISASEEERRVV